MPSHSAPRPPAVLFDLDGTLIDSIALIVGSARHAFRGRTGRIPTDAEWLSELGKPLEAMFRPYAADDADIQALIAAYREHQIENHDKMVVCYDAVVDTVTLLRENGHPVAVVTSKVVEFAVRGLELVGLAPMIDLVVGSDSCLRHKPDPEPVHLALDRLGYAPHEAVFVGDSPFDMQAGAAAGTHTVAALWGPFTRDELEPTRPSAFIASMRELPAVIAGLPWGREAGSAGVAG